MLRRANSVLVRARGDRQVIDQPVVQRPVVLELQRAQRVSDALDRIRLAVRVVVGGIDAPGIAGARMLGVQDAIQHGIAQVHVGRRHVDLRTQHARAVGKLARAHAAEQVEVLLDRAIAVGRILPRFGQRAALAAHPVGRRVIDIGLALADQILGPFVQPLEIVRRVVEVFAPVKAQPVHVALDRVDELLLLLGRVSVVEAKVTPAAKFLRHAEIQGDRLGVADMQIAVRFRRKASHHSRHAANAQVILDDVTNEIAARFDCRRIG